MNHADVSALTPARTLDDFLTLRAAGSPGDMAFTGRSVTDVSARMFGGHLLAQALMAAARTVPDGLRPISVHALFLRPGDAGKQTGYDVGSLRDGRVYATRAVEASQDGRVLASITVQWQRHEDGPIQAEMDTLLPERPGPQSLPYPAPGVLTELFDLRWTDTATGRALWFRTRSALSSDSLVHVAVALYVSDLWLADTLLRRVGERFDSRRVRASSLDHAAWFHRAPRLDGWVCLTSWAPVAARGRGLVQAQLRTPSGRLLATFAQEASVRARTGDDAGSENRLRGSRSTP